MWACDAESWQRLSLCVYALLHGYKVVVHLATAVSVSVHAMRSSLAKVQGMSLSLGNAAAGEFVAASEFVMGASVVNTCWASMQQQWTAASQETLAPPLGEQGLTPEAQ